MLARMRTEAINGKDVTDQQFEAAVAAAPYIHPRLSTSQVRADLRVTDVPPPIDTSLLTDEQREVLQDILLLSDSPRVVGEVAVRLHPAQSTPRGGAPRGR
jgi:hypothetical protein